MEKLTEIVSEFIGSKINADFIENKYILSKMNNINDDLKTLFLNDLDKAIKTKDYSFSEKYKLNTFNTKIEDLILKAVLSKITNKKDLEVAFNVFLKNFHLETLIHVAYRKNFDLKKEYFNILLKKNHINTKGFNQESLNLILRFSCIVNQKNKNPNDLSNFNESVKIFLDENYKKTKELYLNYYKKREYRLEHEIYTNLKSILTKEDIEKLDFFKEIKLNKEESKPLFKETEKKYFILEINNSELSKRLNISTTTETDLFYDYFSDSIQYTDLKEKVQLIFLSKDEEKRVLLFNKIEERNKELIYELIEKMIYFSNEFKIVENNNNIKSQDKNRYDSEREMYIKRFISYMEVLSGIEKNPLKKPKIKI